MSRPRKQVVVYSSEPQKASLLAYALGTKRGIRATAAATPAEIQISADVYAVVVICGPMQAPALAARLWQSSAPVVQVGGEVGELNPAPVALWLAEPSVLEIYEALLLLLQPKRGPKAAQKKM